ncbi:MAG: hypothetical protein QM753_15915 [Thermomicrobiales bacterium]
MIYHLPHPLNLDYDKHDAGYVQAYLVDHNINVESVSINPINITIEAEDDPTDVLAAFTPSPTEREQLLSQLDAINLSTATTAKLREAVTLLKQIVQTAG